MKYLIFYIVMLIAIASYGNTDAIREWLVDLEAEAYIAIGSGVIAVIALWANIREGKETRKNNRLSLRPLLTIGLDSYTKDNIAYTGVELVNKGTGPAIIKKFILRYDGKVKSCDNLKDYKDFLKKSLKGFVSITSGSYIPGGFIKAGEKRQLVGVGYTTETQKKKFDDFVDRLDICIYYQSIYEDEIFIRDTEPYRGHDGRKLL